MFGLIIQTRIEHWTLYFRSVFRRPKPRRMAPMTSMRARLFLSRSCSYFAAISLHKGSRRGQVKKCMTIKVRSTCTVSHSVFQTKTFLVEGFDRLADLIASYPQLLRQAHFVFVPGPLDLTANSVLPRRPLLSSVTSKLRAKLGNKAHFMSNPCRIKFCGQELVIFREDTMARMLRHLVGVKPDVEKDDLQRFVSFGSLEKVPTCADTFAVGSEYYRPEPLEPVHTKRPARLA